MVSGVVDKEKGFAHHGGRMQTCPATTSSTTLDKKRTILEIRGEMNAVSTCDNHARSRAISAGQSRGQSRIGSCPALIALDRA